MQDNRTVKVEFQCSRPWSEPSSAHDLLQLLKGFADVGLSPIRYGPNERRTFELDKLNESKKTQIWRKVGGGQIYAKTPWNLSITILYNKGQKPAISSLWMRLRPEFFDDELRASSFIRLCKDIYGWGYMDHGYVTLSSEYVKKNVFGPGSGVGGPNIRVCLPGIYWANFFGPRYVEWLGATRFENLKTYHKEKLPDGGWMLITRPSVLDYVDPSIPAHEREIIAHLGREAFFEMEDPDKPTKTPLFWR